MQVNSVSSNSVQSFGQHKKPTRQEMLEAFANLNDKQLQQLAIAKADKKYSEKKFRKTQNRIFYSIPIVGALASAITSPQLIKIPEALAKTENLERMGKFVADRARSIKFNRFVGGAVLGTAAFATFDLILKGKRHLENKNKTAGEFAKKHPFLSMLGGLAVTAGVLIGGGLGLSKLAGKASSKMGIGTLRRLAKGKNLLNNNKILNKTSELISKSPAIVKSFAKGALNFAPWLLVLGSLTNSISYSNGKTREIYKNYDHLKTAQAKVRETLENVETQSTEEVDD